MASEHRDTREYLPDDSLPGYLIELRDNGSRLDAITALMEGADWRTRDIAAERLRVLDAEVKEAA